MQDCQREFASAIEAVTSLWAYEYESYDNRIQYDSVPAMLSVLLPCIGQE